MSSFPCRNSLIIIQGILRSFKSWCSSACSLPLASGTSGLDCNHSLYHFDRMLQENEEVHQMSSDNNQKNQARYVCCSYCSVLCIGKGASQRLFEQHQRFSEKYASGRKMCFGGRKEGNTCCTDHLQRRKSAFSWRGPKSSCIDRTFEEARSVPGLFCSSGSLQLELQSPPVYLFTQAVI